MKHARRRSVVRSSSFEASRLREELQDARSLIGTLHGHVAGRDEAIRTFEMTNKTLREVLTERERQIEELKANPVQVSRQREKLPDERRSVAWTLRIGSKDDGTACTVHVGFFPDGRVGEVFLRFNKVERGTHGASMADFACTMMSVALQYGAPLDELLGKMIGAADESGGVTCVRVERDGVEEWSADPDVPMCRSLRDYLGKKLRRRFCEENAA